MDSRVMVGSSINKRWHWKINGNTLCLEPHGTSTLEFQPFWLWSASSNSEKFVWDFNFFQQRCGENLKKIGNPAWGALRIYYMCLLPAIPSWDCDYLSRAYHCIKKSRLHFKVGTLFTDVFVLLHTKSYSNILRLAFCAFVVCRRLASATDEGARLHGCWVSGLWRGIQFPGPNLIGRWLQWRTETNVTPSDISGMWRLEKYNSTRDVMHI